MRFPSFRSCVLLVVAGLVIGILGVETALKVTLGAAVTLGSLVLLGIVLYRRMIKRNKQLPTATLRVRDEEVVFHVRKIGSSYSNAPAGEGGHQLIFAATSKESWIPKITSETEAPATLTFEGREIAFPMVWRRKRCNCSSPIPHWTGTEYMGCFIHADEDSALFGAVYLIVFDHQNKKKRRWQTRPERAEVTLPRFNPNPSPI